MKRATRRWFLAFLFTLASGAVFAEDTLKLAIGQRGNWENAAPELGQKSGIFKKHGLSLELLYTQGAGETLQAVISGSVDVGIGVGTAGVLGAFAKGAPVRVIANSMMVRTIVCASSPSLASASRITALRQFGILISDAAATRRRCPTPCCVSTSG